jgi:gluconate 2-dehydrogenase gamma chain
MSEWPVVGSPLEANSDDRLFFSDHEWETIEAATARVMPTDHEPGAREAGVVRFIDRYLSGIGYVFAAADGTGFLQLSGKQADAWRARIASMQETYRQGVRQLDGLAREHYNDQFKGLGADQQDSVLEILSGFPKPTRLQVTTDSGERTPWDAEATPGEALEPVGYGTVQIWMFDDGLDFFGALTTHTRQGFYSDPVYGGNAGQVGWKVIGFPGPRTLKETTDGTYSVREFYVQDYDWETLIPHLKRLRG